MARAEDANAARDNTSQDNTTAGQTEQADPFGAGDPFAVLNKPQAASESSEAISRKPTHLPDAKVAVYFKEFINGINDASRVNPGNLTYQLKDNTGALQTRMTLSDHFDERQTARWLFRGYTSTSSERGTDGTLINQARIDELFTDWKYHDWFASLGKRRVNWGHAQGFNPVNVVAPPRDPLNPGYETEGRPMAWFSHSGGISTDIILTRNYAANWSSDQNRWGLRLAGSARESDYALYYFDGAPYADGRPYERMLGASFSANVVPGWTLYMELADFAHNYRNYYDASGNSQYQAGSYFQGVVGSSVDLGGKSSLFAEYFYNGQGYTDNQRTNFLLAADTRLALDSQSALVGDFVSLSMNQGYFLVGYKKEYRENYNFYLSVLVAGDRSSSTRAEVSYAMNDYYELRASYLHNAGDRDSEFGNSPYAGLLELGVNASF